MPAPASTIHEQIMAALLLRLQGISGITGLACERNRMQQVQTPPMLLLQDGPVEIDDGTWGLAQHQAGAELIAVAANLPAAQELAGRAMQAIASDPTFGGLAVDCRVEGADPGLAAESNHAGITLPLSILFWTRPGDPFTPGP